MEGVGILGSVDRRVPAGLGVRDASLGLDGDLHRELKLPSIPPRGFNEKLGPVRGAASGDRAVDDLPDVVRKENLDDARRNAR